MNITLQSIKVKDLVTGYSDNNEEGVVGYDGKLDIRPAYQREFVYKDKQQQAVIETILKGFPLNVLYWVKTDTSNADYEVLDGQQRTMSICEYVAGSFSILIDGNTMYFHNLTENLKNTILDYELMVYFCEGSESDKLDWFKTINIAGEKLTDQELRNAVYTGSWLSNAKSHFSKSTCPAYLLGSDYVKGSPIRQELLERVLKWISNNDIDGYMSKHQHDDDCNELWQYYQQVIAWVKMLFSNYRKDMKGIEWGELYNKFKSNTYNSSYLEKRYIEILKDDEVEGKDTKKIYFYLITGELKYLSLRVFSDKQKLVAFEKQNGVCVKCTNIFTLDILEGDHIIPWSKGGKTTQDNCQLLCKKCNASKSNS